MKSIDWSNPTGHRADMVAALIEFCAKHDLSYSYGEKQFSVALPGATLKDVRPSGVRKRKTFNIDNWGPKGMVEAEQTDGTENLPDELPPVGYTLEEGETPVDDKEEK